MKNSTLLKLSVFAFVIAVTFQTCSDDDTDDAAEFIADDSDFANFRDWTEVTVNQGPSPSLGSAHQGNDENATRTVYIKDNQDRVADGKFPVGTLIVKDTRDGDGNTIEVTAMVKRGNEFNPDNNDWEWFMLTPDGDIAEDNGVVMRGAMLMDGMCASCHGQVGDDDFVFSK